MYKANIHISGIAMLALCLIGWNTASVDAQVTATVGNLTGVDVRGNITFPNNTGKDASDLEFEVCTKEGLIPNGGSATTSSFANGKAAFSGDCISFGFDNGTVKAGDSATVGLNFWLQNRNILFVDNAVWTDASHNSIGPAIPPGGFRVGNVHPGGDGGNNNIGGGGRGGQQGGGGAGHFVHKVELVNLGDKAWTVHELKLLASMNYYNDLSADVPWNLVDPINLGSTPLVIGAHSIFTYQFDTTGNYLGGHIYLNYNFDDPIYVLGDHPVTTPEPSGAAVIGSCVMLLTGYALHCKRVSNTRV